ncbi:helix-turn-helix domain-containing protein, partial [Streptomyces sp. NPDC004012]
DYYARLEQGRHPHVSEAVLEAVAHALRLDDTERGYLFELARPRTPGPHRRRPARAPRLRPVVHAAHRAAPQQHALGRLGILSHEPRPEGPELQDHRRDAAVTSLTAKNAKTPA